MPITEAPSSPPSGTPQRPPDAPLLKGRARYEGWEHHELLNLIDALDDERSRARFREGIWIALLAHLLIFWFIAYGPQVIFHQPRVRNPVDVLKERAKDFTYLDMPPDAAKKLPPKPSNIISDKDRIAQTSKPTLDKKTLEQLQAMRRASTPEPPPAQQQQPQQAAPAQQTAQQQQPQPPPQQPQQNLPQNPSQQATLEAPRPAPTRPTFGSSGGSAGDMIRQAARAAAQRGNGNYGNYGADATPQHQGVNTGMEVLSDTMGVDFSAYLKRLQFDIQRNWEPLIPESARPPLSKQGVTGIRFTILPNGAIGNIILESPSGDVALDRAAWGGITGSAPFLPLPKEFHGPLLELRCGFFYNKRPE